MASGHRTFHGNFDQHPRASGRGGKERDRGV